MSLKFPLLAVPVVVYVVRGFVWNLRREPQTRLGVISPTLPHSPLHHHHLPSIRENPLNPVGSTNTNSFQFRHFPTGWSEWRRSGQIGWPYQPIQGLRFGFLRVGDEPSVFPRTGRQQFFLFGDRSDSGGMRSRNSNTWAASAWVSERATDAYPLRNFAPRPNSLGCRADVQPGPTPFIALRALFRFKYSLTLSNN